MIRRDRFGKIVATIGPASSSEEMLEKVFLSGVDVFRLPFSHGKHEDLGDVFKRLRKLGQKHGYMPAIMADLQGPKLRLGDFANGKETLENGDLFRFDLDKTLGDKTRVNLPHPEILQALKVGTTLSIDDGKVKVEVVECSHEHALVKVLVGGTVSNHKGFNVPDIILPIPALTDKDKKDLEFALGLGVDWVAISFVQQVEDIEMAKKLINGNAKLCSKIEKPSAIDCLEEIIEASDAIMVARGDLAVEVCPEMVPILQRTIVDMCHRFGRPVIVATQMLESMISTPTPTRAEASDVATAVYMGADATMLSAECAVGGFPVEAVSMMNSIISHVEDDPQWIDALEYNAQEPLWSVNDACSYGVEEMASIAAASAIVMFSNDYDSVVRLSRARPDAQVILATQCSELLSKAGLIWGVRATIVESCVEFSQKVKKAKELALSLGYAKENDNIVVYSDDGDPIISMVTI